jgi:tetratricopeptide (TPR) repeat protein/TolB-like protein/tRNA A-37 threonylcarbamoyl transferase component Bud32
MSTPSITVGQLLGHYRLVERIGGGGQGEVFRAHDERFDKDVALKILPLKVLADEEARKRFRQEALAVGRLSHPNVATAFYFGEENGIDFLVTEYVAGAGLDEKLAQGPMPEEDVVTLGIQLASGLEAAHHEGIIHRDLKPGNLRITQNGSLKILDFGLAELVDSTIDVASAETVTINMTLTGTLPYMAPEQFGGVSDQRTDLWSAGAVLYEMATGQLPFVETNLNQLRMAILHSHPARPTAINPKISQDLERVILRCLQKDPGKRYQSATELREDLARVAQGQKVSAGDRLRGRGFAVALLAIALAGSGAAMYRFWPQIRTLLGQPPAESTAQFRMLAVLPIQTTGEASSDDALVRGMAETVSARIAQGTNSKRLQLIPPSELIARDAKTTDAVRREFGVDRVLEVAVQRSGEKVRVTCSLIDPKTHQVLNACTVTGDGSDLFALQDTLAGEVIAMLPQGVHNQQAEPSEVQAAAPVGYEFYLKGRGYLLDYQKPENIDSAIQQFEQALKLSPNYAPAYAGLGEAYWQGYKADRGKDWLDKAKVSCEKALTADSKLAEGYVCLGNVYRTQGNYDKALREIQQAVALDPGNVLAVLGLGDTYDKLNQYAEADATFKQAVTLAPNYWAVYNWSGFFYYGRANYAEAEKMFRKSSELAPGNSKVLENLGAMYLLEGRYQDAIDVLQRSIGLRATPIAYGNLGAAYFYLHRFPESVAALRKSSELDNQNYIAWGDLADALYWTPGERDEAPDVYRKAIALAEASVKVNPKDSGALSCVASYSAMLGQRGAAINALHQALTLSPDDPDVMFRAALVYNQFGQRDETMEWLRRATKAGFSRSTIRDTPDFSQLQHDRAFAAIIAPQH